jgi:oligopeptide/dipeptide ABC transporter ATP-binding protein
MQALNPFVSIGKQLRRIVIRHGLSGAHDADERVLSMLGRVGLPDPLRQFRAYPHQLSGGMRQRAMIAAALIAEPDLLVADEPTTALDVTVQAQILELLESIREQTALLLITHDLGIVAGRCGRMLVLEEGRLVEAGATAQVFASPAHQHTAELLAASPRIDHGSPPQPVAGATILEVRNASVSYGERGGKRLQAVRDLDLCIGEGETVAVVGESGSGKSSLVRAALGLVPLRTGTVSFCGEALTARVQTRAMSVRRDLQIVFQDPIGSLNPQMQVAEIVGESLLVHDPGLEKAARLGRVSAMLADVGLDQSFLDRYPHELSGGQAQRVAIARALILQPKVLICDEAVAALDGSVRRQILGLLKDAQRDTGLSIIFITHDLAVVREISHRVMVMYLGRLAELADCAALFSNARHPYTRALIAAIPVPDPAAPGGKATLAGEVPSILSPPSGCAFHPRCPYAIPICTNERPEPRDLDGTTVACHRSEEV